MNTGYAISSVASTDFTFENHGSLFLVRGHNVDAITHLQANVGDEAQWFAGALAVEPRYAPDLYRRLVDAGFSVS